MCAAEAGSACGLTYLVGLTGTSSVSFFDGERLVGRLYQADEPPCPGATWVLAGVVLDCAEPMRDAKSLCYPAKPVVDPGNPKDLLSLP